MTNLNHNTSTATTFDYPPGGVLGPGPSFIETFTGRMIDVLAPTSENIDPLDIACGLAHTCRYAGQIGRSYSVAEHSLLVHDLLQWMGADAELRLAGLLHDAGEAYIGDVVSPLKWALRQFAQPNPYDTISDGLDVAIAERFELTPDLFHDPTVKQADLWALKIEATRLTTTRGAGWSWPAALPNDGELPASILFKSGGDPTCVRVIFEQRVERALIERSAAQ